MAKKKKQSKLPFAVGVAVGAVAGLFMAKKSGNELIEDAKENIDYLKEKAKDIYENKDEIIDKINNQYKKMTQTEIKYYEEPEYYFKKFD